MDQAITQALYALPPAEAYASLADFVQRLSSLDVGVTPGTGVPLIDEAALADVVAQTLPLSLGAPVLRQVRETVADGYLVQDGQSIVPWRFFQSDEGALVAPALVQSLGIPSTVTADRLPLEILSRFPGAPAGVIEKATPSLAAGLRITGGSPAEFGYGIAPLRRVDEDGGGDGGGGGGGGIGATIALTIDQIIQCIVRGDWEIFWWGIRLGLEPVCGRAIGATLMGAALPTLTAAISAAVGAIGAGIVAALGAAAAAAGGLWILAAAAASFLTGSAIQGAITSAGVWLNVSWFLPIIVPTGR